MFVELFLLIGVVIEIEVLKNFCDLVEFYIGVVKFFGVGGGDCGIVIFC